MAGHLPPWQAALILAGVGLVSYLLVGMPLGITTAYAKLGATVESWLWPGHVAALTYFAAQPLDYTPPLANRAIKGGPGPGLDATAANEFVMLSEHLGSPDDCERLAQKIIAALRQPFNIAERELHMGCSIGMTLYPDDGQDARVLLMHADAAMYRAKEAGRDGFARFRHELSEHLNSRLVLENALRVAVREQQFSLHYQPIISLGQGRVVAAEALIRWPQGPGATPDLFIPLAEETRLIQPLGEWVLRQALQQYRAWRSAGMALDYVSVNLSAVQLAQTDFTERLLTLLHETRIAGHHLQIELTENILMRDMLTSQRVLEALRGHGVRVAIDDFGTGYSSLAYLKQLPIDNLKIDRSFVRDIPGDANDSAIATAIIGLARSLGLEAIAEGIETKAQERFLTEIGCDKVQGYLYAKPLAAEAFRNFVAGFGRAAAPTDRAAGRSGRRV